MSNLIRRNRVKYTRGWLSTPDLDFPSDKSLSEKLMPTSSDDLTSRGVSGPSGDSIARAKAFKEVAENHKSLDSLKNRLIRDVDELRSRTLSDLDAQQKQQHQQLSLERKQLLQEIDSEKRKAKEDGLQQGKEEGQRQFDVVKNDYIKKTEDMLQAVHSFHKEKVKILKALEPEVLRLSVAIAEQIVHSEISLNPSVTLNIVGSALSKITDKTKVDIRVNRADFEFINSNRDIIRSYVDDIKNLNIKEDNSLKPGGCIIETDLGVIDAKLETKLAGITELINKTYNDSHSPSDSSHLSFETSSTEHNVSNDEDTDDIKDSSDFMNIEDDNDVFERDDEVRDSITENLNSNDEADNDDPNVFDDFSFDDDDDLDLFTDDSPDLSNENDDGSHAS